RSERLEISYGLLKTQPGAKNLILKNLRVCSDCHSAFKLISKIYKRKVRVKVSFPSCQRWFLYLQKLPEKII
ncbi:pentatricopeptide repeat-containing protein, partial [Quercus suber]